MITRTNVGHVLSIAMITRNRCGEITDLTGAGRGTPTLWMSNMLGQPMELNLTWHIQICLQIIVAWSKLRYNQ